VSEIAWKIGGVEVSLADWRRGVRRPLRRKWRGSGPAIANAYRRGWRSLGIACHPSQVDDYNRQIQALGISGAHYLSDGTAEADSRSARNQLLKAAGIHDNDAGYGDHAG